MSRLLIRFRLNEVPKYCPHSLALNSIMSVSIEIEY